MIAIVVAYAENRGIGYEGELPWRLPGDMRRFRELTSGGTVLMGRKTFQSLPDAYRPLPRRRNLVLSANPSFAAPGAELFGDVATALKGCGSDCFVIGGGTIYEQTLPRVCRVYATEVAGSPLSDTFFPELPSEQWQRSEQTAAISENGTSYRFAIYDRIA
ncbi:MAG TPA: dihydrofolate reductase [Solirubrobacteraceae bacterium]|nr:dihydrofolate reductase [Solirubrobacteraceae bacterium]